MNYWIKDHRAALLEMIKGLDVLVINDTENEVDCRKFEFGSSCAGGD